MCTSIQYFGEVCIKRFMELEENLYKNPSKFTDYIAGVQEEVNKLGCKVIEETLEEMDKLICNSPKRKKHWHVEDHDEKDLLTPLGKVSFTKTLYAHKENRTAEGKQEMCYLLDKALGFTENERMTDDVKAQIYEEAVQTSYRRGGEAASIIDIVSKAAVKDLLHKTKFPPNFVTPKKKKVVENLHIEADEDHFHLQFQNKKGDLEIGKNGRKINGAISKIIYIHEGIVPETPGSKRNKLVGVHYFCRGTKQSNQDLWKEIYAYLDATYDLEKVKKIYVHADGGAWIKEGMKSIAGVKYVLDEFHLSKYVSKMVRHMKDTEDDARAEVYHTIRRENKKTFMELVERLKGCTDDEDVLKRIDDGADYITNNWTAARLRLNKDEGLVGSSTEGHVYHILSKRMSTDPLGWSRHGAEQMAHLLEYYFNKGNMLELAKYQKKVLPVAAGAEELTASASEMLKSENRPRTRQQQEYAKYADAMSATLDLQKRKQYVFYTNRWI